MEKGWTITKLAEVSGVDRSIYGRLRTMRRGPLPETIRNLANALDIPLQEAYELAGLLSVAREAPAEKDEFADDPELAEMLAKLSPRRRAQLERIREEERARYRRMREQAREDWERSQQNLAEIARLEVVKDESESDSD